MSRFAGTHTLKPILSRIIAALGRVAILFANHASVPFEHDASANAVRADSIATALAALHSSSANRLTIGPRSTAHWTSSGLAPATSRWLVQLRLAHAVVAGDSTQITIGDPAREIVRTAADAGSPLVVVGVRGADEAPAGSIGSVARELLARAPVPVLALDTI